MCIVDGGKTNPLIGSAGVSAVPMAARVSQIVGQQANPGNFLLMHAMGHSGWCNWYGSCCWYHAGNDWTCTISFNLKSGYDRNVITTFLMS